MTRRRRGGAGGGRRHVLRAGLRVLTKGDVMVLRRLPPTGWRPSRSEGAAGTSDARAGVGTLRVLLEVLG